MHTLTIVFWLVWLPIAKCVLCILSFNIHVCKFQTLYYPQIEQPKRGGKSIKFNAGKECAFEVCTPHVVTLFCTSFVWHNRTQKTTSAKFFSSLDISSYFFPSLFSSFQMAGAKIADRLAMHPIHIKLELSNAGPITGTLPIPLASLVRRLFILFPSLLFRCHSYAVQVTERLLNTDVSNIVMGTRCVFCESLNPSL